MTSAAFPVSFYICCAQPLLDSMSRHIAVTGATGHLGNVVCRILCANGWHVRALYRSEASMLSRLPLELVQGDVLNLPSLEKFFEGCDIVIHCAAIISVHGDPDGMVYKTNTEGPGNVLKAATKAGVKRIVHISSVHAVEELPHSAPFDEKRPYKRKGAYPYDLSKAEGEQILLSSGQAGAPEIVVLRPSAIIGPYDFKPSELGKAMLDFYRRKIPALPEGGYNFVDVRDVAQSVVQAIDQARAGEVYLLTGKYYSMKAFARMVQDVTGVRTTKMVLPFYLLRALLPLISLWSKISGASPVLSLEAIVAVKNGHPDMDNSKAVSELGHQSRPLEESIRDFYEWYQNNEGKL